MPEPLRSRLRPIPMMRTLAAPAAALVLLGGCGSADQPNGETAGSGEATTASTPSPSGSPGACPDPGSGGDSTTVENLAKVDLNGDGTPDQVGVRTAVVGCPPSLVAEVAGTTVGRGIPTDEPAVRSAFGVGLPGRQGALLVTRQDHPRGGFQLRVYGLDDNELTELEVEGRSLVPFVALDVQEHPLSIDCGDGGLVLTEAVAHEPAGVMFAWDIRRTSYAVDGNEVTPGTTDEIADNVLPNQLKAKYPDLVKHTTFTNCRADG